MVFPLNRPGSFHYNPTITKEGELWMKGMYWAWVAALLMGLGIVTFVNAVSQPQKTAPVFATKETTEMLG